MSNFRSSVVKAGNQTATEDKGKCLNAWEIILLYSTKMLMKRSVPFQVVHIYYKCYIWEKLYVCSNKYFYFEIDALAEWLDALWYKQYFSVYRVHML